MASEVTLASDFYIAIGSTLLVEPAASFPRIARRAGASLVILKDSETPLDDYADLVINDRISETLQALLQRLGYAS
jgi:NAD-dependent deacetylase